jgi:acetolactate synthase-1/2/3 large subunit
MRVADFIIQRLFAEGVKHIFLLPGGGAMHLNDALAKERRIEAVACHHEQVCGIAAEAYGRTGSPENPGFGVALVTTGPGASNVITAVTGAWIDSVPMLVISGQVKRADRRGTWAGRQSGVQEVDVISMVRGITKFSATVESASDTPRILDDALRAMRSLRPGPVWIEVPLDIQGSTISGFEADISASLYVGTDSEPLSIDSRLDIIRECVNTSERPLVLAGHGVRLSGAASQFRDFVERWSLPVVTTWNALDLLPFSHRLNVGRPGVVAARGPNFAIQNCDLLLVLGCRLDNVITAYNLQGFAPLAKKIVIDVDKAELDRLEGFANHRFQCDARRAIQFLIDQSCELTPQRASWLDQCSDWKARYSAATYSSSSEDDRISHYALVDSLSDYIPANTMVVTGSSGLSIEAFYCFFKNREGQRLFLTSGLGSMGYGLPAAIGACIGSERRPVVLIEGDGSLMLNLQELATVAGLKLPIRIVVFDNNGYASIRNTQKNYFQSRFLATGPDSGLHMPNLVAVARAFGISATMIDKMADLKGAIEQLISLDGPALLVVKVSEDEVLAPKVSVITQPDGSLLSMPLEDMSPLLSLDELRKNMPYGVSTASLRARLPG